MNEWKAEGLPKQLLEDFFYTIDEWFGNWLQINPPHVCDFLSPNDANYRAHKTRHDDGDHNHSELDNPMDMQKTNGTDGTGGVTPP